MSSASLAAFAPAALQRLWRWLLALALLLALVAVGVDIARRAGAVEPNAFAARITAAAAMGVCGGVLVWSLMERRARGLQRRRAGLAIFAAGNAVLYFGQVLGYVYTARDSGIFPGLVEAGPLLIAGPLLALGMFLLCWPPGLNRADRWAIARDSTLAFVALVTIWAAMVEPAQRSWVNATGNLVEQLDPWVQLLGFLSLVVVASASRRSGMLPVYQLILLQGGVLVFLLSDILGQVIPAADLQSQITYSIVGYCLSAYLVMSFAIRPAIETDPPDGARLRDVWSYLIPFLPVPLAGLALLAARLVYGPLEGVVLVLAITTVVLAGGVIALDRLSLVAERRMVSGEVLAANLRDSTGSEWFGALIGDSQDLVTVLNREGRIVYQTPTLLPMLGYDRDTYAGRYFDELTEGHTRRDIAELLLRATHDPDDRGPYEMNLVARDGVHHATETVITPLRADGADGFVLTSRDVTDRRRLRSEFAESTLRDPLTRLPNRDSFLSRIRLESPVATPGGLAVALFDLASFRDLNDSRGHEVGDQVLRLVAQALETLPDHVRAVARTGPDEFGLIVVHDPVEFAMGEVERELEDQFNGVLLSDGRVHTIEFDMGYTVLTTRGSASLLEQADLALAESRTLPGSALVRYDPVLRSALVDRLRAEADLREALDGGRLIVHYQPVVELATGAMCGLEALARMEGRDGSIVPPGRFIPIAESLGLIDQIGESVLRQALADITLVNRALRRDVSISVNVSADQLDESLPALVAGLLADTGVPPGQLVLELTETALAGNREQARDLLGQLRGIGCSIALDDFGTGYSSMAYLAELPVDWLKIDRSFVGSMGSSRKSLVLVRTLLQMTHSLGLTAVAEGVETLEQADLLRGMDCERVQGYLYARPMALADLITLLQVTDGALPLNAQ